MVKQTMTTRDCLYVRTSVNPTPRDGKSTRVGSVLLNVNSAGVLAVSTTLRLLLALQSQTPHYHHHLILLFCAAPQHWAQHRTPLLLDCWGGALPFMRLYLLFIDQRGLKLFV